ncbi:TVP38/TMEM64 family protein [Candidatus Pacearchaeota archaeon]|nr:TVP38/TMEM64 family protein [Candidatus Pacearchaeota archaeon]
MKNYIKRGLEKRKAIFNEATTRDKVNFAIFILLILFFIGFLYYSNIINYTSSSKIQEEIERFGILVPIVFVIFYSIATAALLPATLLIITGGALFGTIEGMIYVAIGSILGALLSFFIAKYLGKSFVDRVLYKNFEVLRIYNQLLKKGGILATFILRLAPFHYSGISYALGLTDVKSTHYLIGTLLGILPSIIILTYFGDSLARFDWLGIVVSIILIGLLALVYPIYIKKVRREMKEGE